MNTVRHYIDFYDGNGYVEVTPPAEWKTLEIEWNFVSDELRLSTTNFTWIGEVAQKINTYIAGGMIPAGQPGSTPGKMEGPPYKIVIDCDGQLYTVIEACLKTNDRGATFFCDKVICPIKETGKIDYLTDRARSFRFEILSTVSGSGSIGLSDYIDIWYQAGRYPQSEKIMFTTVMSLLMYKEIYETIKRILDCAAAVSGGATGTAESVLQIISLTIYLGLVVIAFVNALNSLSELIFPFVYYHRAMYERTLWEKGASYLGLTYQSSFHSPGSVDYNNYLMPPKNDITGKKVGQSSSETGYYDGTFLQFIEGQIEKYNGEIKVIGNVLHFEEKGSFASMSNFRIPELSYEGVKDNASELPGTYFISYLYDGIDLYDYEAYFGRKVSASTTPITVQNKKNILFEEGVERRIPYSLPNVKTSQSKLEQSMASTFNLFANLVNAVSSLISPGSPTIPTIPTGGSINILQLESHFTSVHKNGVYLGGGKTDPNSLSILAASRYLKENHKNEIAKPIYGGTGNQWKIYGEGEEYEIPFCCDDAISLSQVNYAKFEGSPARFINIKWAYYNEMAKIQFEKNEIYTNNLKVTIQEKGSADIVL